MGSTHRFLAIGDDIPRIGDWFAKLPDPPTIIKGQGCDYLHFASLGVLRNVPVTGQIDVQASPIASLFHPELLNSVLWTAGELHFLPTPLRSLFPQLDAISRRFAKWLRGFQCVFEGPGATGEWNYYLEGSLRNDDSPIFALPEAMKALSSGQYFVEHGIRNERLSKLLRTLELRDVHSGSADTPPQAP